MTDAITVRLEDCHLRPNARPLDKAHVAELVESMKLIGFSPSEPMLLKEDAPGFYWIIDGGHRHAAATEAGLEVGPAICDQLDDEHTLVHEGVLNLSRPDTEEEKWARAQQFFALGVTDDHAIEVATGIKPEAQHKVRRALKRLNDSTAAEDTTLPQALAASEFEDDEESFKAIMTAGANWERVISDIKREKRLVEDRVKCVETIEAAGAEVVEDGWEKPEGVNYIAQTYNHPHKAPEGATFGMLYSYGSYCTIQWYGVRAGSAETAEQAAEREAAEKARAEWNHGRDESRKARFAFLRERIEVIDRSLLVLLVDHFFAGDSNQWVDFGDKDGMLEFFELEEFDPSTASPAAMLMARLFVDLDDETLGNLNPGRHMSEYYARLIRRYLEAIGALGYVLSQWEQGVWDAATVAIEEAENAAAQTNLDEGGE